MPPPGKGAPKGGAVAKAEAAAAKDALARKAAEAAEEAAWADGANSKAKKRAEESAAQQAEKLARKAAVDAQLKLEAEEGARQKARGAEKVAARQAQKVSKESAFRDEAAAPVITGSGLDSALAAMTLACEGGGDADGGADGGAGGGEALEAGLERARAGMAAENAGLRGAEDMHPERRAKAAFARYRERELPLLKKEFPSLRMSQHLEMLQRAWSKSKENPLVVAAALEQARAREG